MAYSKPEQAPFAANLAAGEFVVQLDSGEFVAVRAVNSVEPNTGNTVVEAWAWIVTSNGETSRDAIGDPLSSTYSFNADAVSLAALGGIDQLQRKMLLTVLGEDAGWPNAPHADILAHASIRSTLTAAAHAGVAENIGNLL